VVGTPLLYRTTKEFLVHFGLNELSELPQPEELAATEGEIVSGG
jgi:segregation and condensation protein B